MADYDAIIIGAGNGGLTSSATLAKAGKKVLLLEKHNIPGGCGTSFIRGRFEFETALHQLSGIGTKENPGPLRAIFRRLEIEDQIDWIQMDNLYRIVLPGQLDISLPANKEEAIKILQEKFPEEKDNIKKFYDTVYQYLFESFMLSKTPENKIDTGKFPLYFKYNLKTLEEVMNEFFTDPMLHLAINFYWCYMGLPPEKIPFDIIAANIYMYMEMKPYHVKGRSQMMSSSLADIVLQNNGDIRFNCGVKKILVKDGRAFGVVTEHDEQFTADYIISNISPINTYVNLMDEQEIPEEALYNMRNQKIGVSAFTIYIGLDCTPDVVGIKESLNVFYSRADVNKGFKAAYRIDTEEDFYILSCYTLDNPEGSPAGTSEISIVALKYAEPWLELPPEQYNEMKYKCAETLISRLEKHFPDLRNHIEEMEIASPITHMRYLGHPGGAIYGFETPVNNSGIFFKTDSPVKNLHFAGTWTGWDGFQPTLTSGYVLGRQLLKQMNEEVK